jgi:hypothetical protein
MLSNPSFGKDYKNIREEVEVEHARSAEQKLHRALSGPTAT